MATWSLTATKDDDQVTVLATSPDGLQTVRFTAWASHLEALTPAQRRTYLARRIKQAFAAPTAYTVPATADA